MHTRRIAAILAVTFGILCATSERNLGEENNNETLPKPVHYLNPENSPARFTVTSSNQTETAFSLLEASKVKSKRISPKVLQNLGTLIRQEPPYKYVSPRHATKSTTKPAASNFKLPIILGRSAKEGKKGIKISKARTGQWWDMSRAGGCYCNIIRFRHKRCYRYTTPENNFRFVASARGCQQVGCKAVFKCDNLTGRFWCVKKAMTRTTERDQYATLKFGRSMCRDTPKIGTFLERYQKSLTPRVFPDISDEAKEKLRRRRRINNFNLQSDRNMRKGTSKRARGRNGRIRNGNYKRTLPYRSPVTGNQRTSPRTGNTRLQEQGGKENDSNSRKSSSGYYGSFDRYTRPGRGGGGRSGRGRGSRGRRGRGRGSRGRHGRGRGSRGRGSRGRGVGGRGKGIVGRGMRRLRMISARLVSALKHAIPSWQIQRK